MLVCLKKEKAPNYAAMPQNSFQWANDQYNEYDRALGIYMGPQNPTECHMLVFEA